MSFEMAREESSGHLTLFSRFPKDESTRAFFPLLASAITLASFPFPQPRQEQHVRADSDFPSRPRPIYVHENQQYHPIPARRALPSTGERAVSVPLDLGGFFYVFFLGRRIHGCPSASLISAHSKRGTAGFEGRAEKSGDPCDLSHVLYDEVVDPTRVLKEDGILVPAYLWGSIRDGVEGLKSGFPIEQWQFHRVYRKILSVFLYKR